MQTITKRSDIPQEYTWNLESIFPTNDDWERAYKSLQERVPVLENLKGTLVQSGDALLNVLKRRDEIVKDLETLYVYASMRRDEDTTNSLYQSMADRAMQIYVRISTASAYIEPEILSVPQETLERFIQETPGLKLYEHQLHDLNRQRAHVRSSEVEAILASAGEIAESPDTIFGMIDNADMQLPRIKNENGEEVALTKGNYQVFIRSTNREVRKAAFEALHQTFLKQRNTLGATLYSQIKSTSFFTRQRGYKSNRERALSAHNIPEGVYDMLVETVSEHIPLLNRYLKLRKKLLQLDELHMYDLYVPIIEERETHMTYEQAQDVVQTALAPLGSDYVGTLKKAFSER